MAGILRPALGGPRAPALLSLPEKEEGQRPEPIVASAVVRCRGPAPPAVRVSVPGGLGEAVSPAAATGRLNSRPHRASAIPPPTAVPWRQRSANTRGPITVAQQVPGVPCRAGLSPWTLSEGPWFTPLLWAGVPLAGPHLPSPAPGAAAHGCLHVEATDKPLSAVHHGLCPKRSHPSQASGRLLALTHSPIQGTPEAWAKASSAGAQQRGRGASSPTRVSVRAEATSVPPRELLRVRLSPGPTLGGSSRLRPPCPSPQLSEVSMFGPRRERRAWKHHPRLRAREGGSGVSPEKGESGSWQGREVAGSWGEAPGPRYAGALHDTSGRVLALSPHVPGRHLWPPTAL